jgi:hypothetical protein
MAGIALMLIGLGLTFLGPRISEATMIKAKGNIKRGIWRHAEKAAGISGLGIILFSQGTVMLMGN